MPDILFLQLIQHSNILENVGMLYENNFVNSEMQRAVIEHLQYRLIRRPETECINIFRRLPESSPPSGGTPLKARLAKSGASGGGSADEKSYRLVNQAKLTKRLRISFYSSYSALFGQFKAGLVRNLISYLVSYPNII